MTQKERNVVRSLFNDGVDSVRFSETFLKSASKSEVRQVLESLKTDLGDLSHVKEERDHYKARFEKGTANVLIDVNNNGLITGLYIKNVVLFGESIKHAVDDFLALPGETSISILRNGKPYLREGTDSALFCGSAFKIAVLAALEYTIDNQRSSWDNVLELGDIDRSLPTGIMHRWPTGTMVTVDSAAVMMMSLSDNTASDLLVRHLGRKTVEQFSPHSVPFLTTREAFILSQPDYSQLTERYRSMNEEERRELLSTISDIDKYRLPPPEASSNVLHPAIGWRFETMQLALLLSKIETKRLLSVGQPPFDTAPWSSFGYKGGESSGVINATFWLSGDDGTTYSISMTQNAEEDEIDRDQFFTRVGSIATQLSFLPPADKSDHN
ncbi:serine hydrolase [Ectothiorhodospiraceae bacterium WFHF3C12]|nr:serine hydrolase [Ectothiorhodospiraceae bacterium WFHF3C12]